MKVRQLITLSVVSLVATAVVGPMCAQAGRQAKGCADANWPALQSSTPAYLDAVELAETLTDYGFTVMCIAPSKMTGMFEGQKGAAVYRTDRGAFDALFLPKQRNFDRLQIIERQETGRYLYSFAGRPTPWPANLIDGSGPVFFIKHTNRLIAAYDKELADHLGAALADR